MGKNERQAYLKAIRCRYRQARKKAKVIILNETGTLVTNICLLEGLLLLRVRRCLPIDETVPMAGRSGAGVC